MSRIDAFGTAASSYMQNNSVGKKNVKGTSEAKKADKAEKPDRASNVKTPELSEKARALLDKLKEKYENADIMVADFSSDEEAKDIMSRGTKEFSILLTSDELEKMANDEEVEKENTTKIDDAMAFSEDVKAEAEKNGSEVKSFGVSFNSDGTVSYFAELEKASKAQSERIQAERDQKRADAKEAAKKAEKEQAEKRAEEKRGANKGSSLYGKDGKMAMGDDVKRTSVQANSAEELLEAIGKVDWENIKGVQKETQGGKFDFTA